MFPIFFAKFRSIVDQSCVLTLMRGNESRSIIIICSKLIFLSLPEMVQDLFFNLDFHSQRHDDEILIALLMSR